MSMSSLEKRIMNITEGIFSLTAREKFVKRSLIFLERIIQHDTRVKKFSIIFASQAKNVLTPLK